MNTVTIPVTVTQAVTAPTPGYKTTEFWLKLAAIILTALFAGGVIPTSGVVAQVAAIAATMLGALGYTVSRTMLKKAHVDATAPLELPPANDNAPAASAAPVAPTPTPKAA